jgi:WD40 repeat protein
MKRVVIVLFIVQFILPGYGVDVPLHPGTVVRFASLEEGQQILGSVDDYVRNMSPFERQAILKSQNPVTEEGFLLFASKQVAEWDEEQISDATVKIKRVASMLEKLDLNLPEVIYLIQTPRSSYSDYSTRQNAINCPSKINQCDLAHGIFHIFSRYNPTIRDELYSIIGYQPCGAPIEYPESIIKITNPDAPVTEHYITVRYQGEALTVAPIYYSNRETYDGGDLFDYIQYGLMAVEESSEGWTYKRVNGEPLILEESDVEGYWDQVGEKSQYNIHPEERMAENFRILCSGRPGHIWRLKTPHIIEEMDALLGGGPRQSVETVTEPLREFTESLSVDYWINSMVFSKDGSRIMTCTSSYLGVIISTWDTATGLKLDTFSVDGPSHYFKTYFSPYGTYILLKFNNRITIWDVKNKQPMYTLQHPKYSSPFVDWAFSPDETEFLTTSTYRPATAYGSTYEATVWDTVTGLELKTFSIDSPYHPFYLPDGSHVLISHSVYNTTTGLGESAPDAMYMTTSFSPDGARMLATNFKISVPDDYSAGGARLSDTVNNEELRSFAFAYGAGVFRALFSPDGKFILTSGAENTVSLWNATAEKEIRVFQHPWEHNDAIFSPDGNYILTGGGEIARLWDIRDLVTTSGISDEKWTLY